MASIIRQFTVTIPANTPTNALYSASIGFAYEQVLSVDLEVPPGPSGLMGFYLATSGQQIIPFESGQFIVWDDYRASWDLQDYPEANQWSVVGYNLDIVNGHQVVVRFHDAALQPVAQASPPILTSANAESAPVLLS